MRVLTLFAALLSMMLVSGCVGTPNSTSAISLGIRPLAKDHAAALAACNVPECNESILTGTRLISALNGAIGKAQ